jgi:hypothetical protein
MAIFCSLANIPYPLASSTGNFVNSELLVELDYQAAFGKLP